MHPASMGEVGCFGKLPLSPEFIRVNAKGPTLQALDQWIQEGLLFCRAKMGPQWRNEFLQSDTWHFLYQVPKEKEWLIGVMTPSQDKAGRGFPMTVFLRMARTETNKELAAMLPLFLQEFLEKAQYLLQEGWKNYTLIQFRESIGQLMSGGVLQREQVAQLYQEFLGSYSLKALLGISGVMTEHLTESQVKGLVQTMVAQHRPSLNSQMSHLMGFPLIDEPALPFEIPFWVEYVSSLNTKPMSWPLMFWNKNPKKGRAMLLTQEAPVTPKSFSTLIQSNQHLEKVWNMRPLEDDTQPIELLEDPVEGSDQTNESASQSLHHLLQGQHT